MISLFLTTPASQPEALAPPTPPQEYSHFLSMSPHTARNVSLLWGTSCSPLALSQPLNTGAASLGQGSNLLLAEPLEGTQPAAQRPKHLP